MHEGQGGGEVSSRVTVAEPGADGHPEGEVADPEREEQEALVEEQRLEGRARGHGEPVHVEPGLDQDGGKHRHPCCGWPARPDQEDQVELRDQQQEVEMSAAAGPPVGHRRGAVSDLAGKEDADQAVDGSPEQPGHQGAAQAPHQEVRARLRLAAPIGEQNAAQHHEQRDAYAGEKIEPCPHQAIDPGRLIGPVVSVNHDHEKRGQDPDRVGARQARRGSRAQPAGRRASG